MQNLEERKLSHVHLKYMGVKSMLKIFSIIILTASLFGFSNEHNQSKVPRNTTGQVIIMADDNNKFISYNIRIGNSDLNKSLEVKGDFKLISMVGKVMDNYVQTFRIPPKTANTYEVNSLNVNVSKDTKAYIQANIGGVISRSDYFIINK